MKLLTTCRLQSILPLSSEDQRVRYLYQLINREHHFVTALSFGMQRFVSPLHELKDLISQSDHRTLFQNLDEVSFADHSFKPISCSEH